jgi:ketosteroid isomerase-like protein
VNSLTRLFAEDLWSLVGVFALAELGLVIALVRTGRRGLLVPVAILPIVAALLVVVEVMVVTDREQIDGLIDEMRAAVLAEDADGFVKHLAPQCRYGNIGPEHIRQTAATVFGMFDIERLKISNRKTQVSRLRREATAEFLAVARGRQGELEFAPYPTRWILTFQQSREGQWRVVEIQQIAAFGQDRQPMEPLFPGEIPGP